jgi:hypothetical protein
MENEPTGYSTYVFELSNTLIPFVDTKRNDCAILGSRLFYS